MANWGDYGFDAYFTRRNTQGGSFLTSSYSTSDSLVGNLPNAQNTGGADVTLDPNSLGNLVVDGGLTNSKIKELSVDKLIAGTIRSQFIHLAVREGEGSVFIAAGKTFFGDDVPGFIMGIDDDDDNKVKLEFGDDTEYLRWNEDDGLVISGNISATTGEIGGWTITSDTIESGDFILNSDLQQLLIGDATGVMTGDGVFLGLDSGAYQFRVGDPSGAYMHWDDNNLYLSDGIITSLGLGSDLSIQGWQFTGTFSATDYNTVTWTSGTLSFPDGSSYSIAGGSTGNISTLNYIYFSLDDDDDAFLLTTNSTTAVGTNKVIIAVAQNNSDTDKDATFQVFGGSGGQGVFVTADNVAANTITANEIAANTITAAQIQAGTITADEIAAGTITAVKMDVAELSAISADMGTITAGDITLDSAGFIRGGATNYTTTAGFWMGYDGGQYKLRIGDPSGDYLTWDGSQLTVIGNVTATSINATTGSIGGFDIGTDYVRDVANSFGLASTVTGSDDVRLWAGDTFANRATAPFRVTEAGALVATSANITGSITATSGVLGGWTASSTALTAGSGSTTVGLDTTSTGGDDIRIYAGNATPSSAPFRVYESGAFVASNATITGNITATSGTLGGWTAGATTLTGGDATLDSAGILSLGTSDDVVVLSSDDADYRLWIGDATAGDAPFRVEKDGSFVAENASITGTINATIGNIGGFDIGADYIRDTENLFGLSSEVLPAIPITASYVGVARSTTSSNIVMFSNVDIPNNEVCLMFIDSTHGSGASIPESVWDAASPWDLVYEYSSSSTTKHSVWRRCAPGGTLNVVVQYSSNQSTIHAVITSLQNVDTRGSNGEFAVVRVTENLHSSSTNTGVTHNMGGSFESPDNATLIWLRNSTTNSISVPSGFSNIISNGSPTRVNLAFKNSNQSSFSWSWSSQTVSSRTLGIELRARPSNVRFWAGSTFNNKDKAPVSIYDDGQILLKQQDGKTRMSLRDSNISLFDSYGTRGLSFSTESIIGGALIRGVIGGSQILDISSSDTRGEDSWSRTSIRVDGGSDQYSVIWAEVNPVGFNGVTNVSLFSQGISGSYTGIYLRPKYHSLLSPNSTLVLDTDGTIEMGATTIPGSNNTYTLGGSSNRWSTIYGVNGNLSGNLTLSGNLAISGTINGFEAVSNPIYYDSSSGSISTSTPRLAIIGNNHNIFIVRAAERAAFFGRNNNGAVVQFINNGSSAGNISNSGTTTSYNTGSDRRIKKNITDTRFGLSDLMNIKVRDYQMRQDIENPDQIRTGLIAQELYKVYPEAVWRGRIRFKRDKETGEKKITERMPWGIDYGKLTPIIIKSVQQQQEKIEKLEAALKQLGVNL